MSQIYGIKRRLLYSITFVNVIPLCALHGEEYIQILDFFISNKDFSRRFPNSYDVHVYHIEGSEMYFTCTTHIHFT